MMILNDALRGKYELMGVLLAIMCLFVSSCPAEDIENKNEGSEEAKGTRKVVRKFYEDGKLKSEIPMIDDIVDGIIRVYHENGAISFLIPVKNGKMHGIVRSYLDNGSLLEEEEYRDGEKHGIWRMYGDGGKLIVDKWHWNGEEVSHDEFLRRTEEERKESIESSKLSQINSYTKMVLPTFEYMRRDVKDLIAPQQFVLKANSPSWRLGGLA